jgi:hypothetical protein
MISPTCHYTPVNEGANMSFVVLNGVGLEIVGNTDFPECSQYEGKNLMIYCWWPTKLW